MADFGRVSFTLNGVDMADMVTAAEWSCEPRPAMPVIQRLTAYTAEGTITFDRGEWERVVDALLRAHSRYWARRRRFKNDRMRRRVARSLGMSWRQWEAWIATMRENMEARRG